MSDITLTMPDGAKRAVPKGTSGLDVAKSIAPSLAKRTVAMVLGVWCVVGLVLCLVTFRWTDRRDR